MTKLINLTQSQNETYAFIKRFIEEKGVAPTTAEITQGLGLKSRSAVHRNLQAIAEEGFIELLPNRRRNIRLAQAANECLLPVLGRIAAGEPLEAVAQREQEYMDLNALVFGVDRYLLKVKGDSMIGDNICDGDLVICEQTRQVPKGQIAVVVINREEATLKRVLEDEAKHRIWLVPSNPSLSPVEYPPEQVEIQGRYLGLVRFQ